MKSITLLEKMAIVSLGLVILALGWITLMAANPTWLHLPSVQMEVLLVLGLLTATLLLVSAVALQQTRG